MRILLVEDDKNLGQATASGLRENFAVDWVENAEDASEAIETTDYLMIALDINLPGQSGLEFLKSLRLNNSQMPVLLLTARDATYHKVEGFNSGADDYLVKPFDLDELLARCNALIRRSSVKTNSVINHQDLTYEVVSRHLEKQGQSISLSNRELAIFDLLIRNIGRYQSKDKIAESIYDWSSDNIESNTIEVHIASLRRKIGKDIIKTARGLGYAIT